MFIRKNIGLILVGFLIICNNVFNIIMLSMHIHLENYFILLMYITLTSIIFIERNNLQVFKIDRMSLVLLIFSAFARRRLAFEYENIHLILIGICGVIILIICIMKWKTLPIPSMKWIIIALLLPCLLIIPFSFFQNNISSTIEKYLNYPEVFNILLFRNLFYLLSFVTPLEEFLFRGFLWGYLIKIGLSDNKAFLIQFVIFWLSHLVGIIQPFGFFIFIPLSIMLLSILRKFSNSIFPSNLAHLLLNVLISLATYTLF
jgi:hypothetical protein